MSIEEQYFTCKKCGESKIWGEFTKHKQCKLGITMTCYICSKRYHKEYYAANSDLIRSRSKKYAEDNKDYVKTRQKSWYKEYYRRNAERLRAKSKKWREENPDANRIFHQRNPNWYAGYYRKNKDKLSNRAKSIRAKYLEKFRSRDKKVVDTMPDHYIRKVLKFKGFTSDDITKNIELINIQRTIIQMRRLCKTSNN